MTTFQPSFVVFAATCFIVHHSFCNGQSSQNYLETFYGGCFTDDLFPVVVTQFAVDTCFQFKQLSNSTKYTTSTSADDRVVTLTANYYKNNGNCSSSPTKSEVVLNTTYLCSKSSNNVGQIVSTPWKPSTNVYAQVSWYDDIPSCISSSNYYKQTTFDTSKTRLCLYYSPTNQHVTIQCVQSPQRGTQNLLLKPIFAFYAATDTTCTGQQVSVMIGRSSLLGCDVASTATPMTIACPSCSQTAANPCYYWSAARSSKAMWGPLWRIVILSMAMSIAISWNCI